MDETWTVCHILVHFESEIYNYAKLKPFKNGLVTKLILRHFISDKICLLGETSCFNTMTLYASFEWNLCVFCFNAFWMWNELCIADSWKEKPHEEFLKIWNMKKWLLETNEKNELIWAMYEVFQGILNVKWSDMPSWKLKRKMMWRASIFKYWQMVLATKTRVFRSLFYKTKCWENLLTPGK